MLYTNILNRPESAPLKHVFYCRITMLLYHKQNKQLQKQYNEQQNYYHDWGYLSDSEGKYYNYLEKHKFPSL